MKWDSLKGIVSILIVYPITLYAAGIQVDPADTFKKETSAGTITCIEIDGLGFIAGELKLGTNFLTYDQLKAQTKSKMAGKSGNALKKLKKKLKKYKKKNKQGSACNSGPGDSQDPAPGGANFDVFGNVTVTGKIKFGIPLSLPASTGEGLLVYNSNCKGCHDPELNRTFPEYREKTKQSPMLFDEKSLPDAELANLTAYLNRFKLY